MDGETSRDWDLIAVAENLLDHVCHSRKTRSATLATRRHGRPFAVYYKIDPHILSGADISDHVYYSRTAYPWYEPVVAPTQLSLWIATFVLCAAVQPTGRILGRDFEAPWVMRCFPIMYAADAVACLGSWARLAVFSGQGVVGAATQVLRDRNTGSESDEWPLALEKMKAAAPARWAVFVAGVLPCFLKLCVAGGLFHAQVLGCMYVGGWLIFEALVLAAATDATETSDDEPDASTSEDSADATPPKDTADTNVTEDTGDVVSSDDTTEEASENTPDASTPDSPTDAPAPNEQDISPSPAWLGNLPAHLHSLFVTSAIVASAVHYYFPIIKEDVLLWRALLTNGGLADEPNVGELSIIGKQVAGLLLPWLWIKMLLQDLRGHASLAGDESLVFGYGSIMKVSSFLYLSMLAGRMIPLDEGFASDLASGVLPIGLYLVLQRLLGPPDDTDGTQVVSVMRLSLLLSGLMAYGLWVDGNGNASALPQWLDDLP